VTVKMTKPYRKVPAKTSIQYPYRAVMCGEEHIVQGWRGGNLLTDKGEFVFRRLHGKQVESEWTGAIPGGVPSDYPIQSTTLLEVATLQSDGNGGWLLNGHNFGSLQFLPAGCRLNGITSSEVLRVHKGEIHAVAWVQAISTGSITLQLDTVLADWKAARQLGKANPTFAMPDSLSVSLFCGWSKPIWLTEFHGANKNPWLDGISKVLEAGESASMPAPDSLADMLEKGINPFLAGLENIPVKSKGVEQAAADHQKDGGDAVAKQIQAATSELRAVTEQLAEVAQPFREMYKDQRLAGAKADALKAGIPELVVDVVVRLYHTSKMPTTDGLVKYLNSSGDSTKLESAGQGTSRATIGRWLTEFKKIMRRRGLIQNSRPPKIEAKGQLADNSAGVENFNSAADQSGLTTADTRTQELPEGAEDLGD